MSKRQSQSSLDGWVKRSRENMEGSGGETESALVKPSTSKDSGPQSAVTDVQSQRLQGSESVAQSKTMPDPTLPPPIVFMTPVPALASNSSENKADEDLMSPGKPNQPDFPLPPPVARSDGRSINFQTKWYEQYKWLHFIPSKGAVFCFPCRDAFFKKLFLPSTRLEQAFIDVGFKNWNKANEVFRGHASGKQHEEAITALSQSQSSSIEAKLKKESQEVYEKNRSALRVICSSVKFLARQGLPMLGHDSGSGNFMELMKIRSEDIPYLKTWLQRYNNYTSHDILNEILEIMANQILRSHLETIRASRYVSLIVDETTDVSTKEQLSMTIRIVNKNLEPIEYFMGLYEVSSTTGENLTSVILDILKRFNIPIEKVRGQCYDGASNMKGKFRGVQKRIMDMEPRAVYMHCLSHSLNLALQDSVRKIPLMRDILQNVNDVAVLIGRSPKRVNMFQDVAVELGYDKVVSLKALCPTRWSVRVKSLSSILSNYPVMLQCLENLSASSDKCASKASGLLTHFRQQNTLFGIFTLHRAFELCEKLVNILQKPTTTISSSIQCAEMLTIGLQDLLDDKVLEAIRKDVSEISAKWELDVPVLPRQVKVSKRLQESGVAQITTTSRRSTTIEEYQKDIFTTTIECLIKEISDRFCQPGVNELAAFENIITGVDDLSSEKSLNLLQKYELDSNMVKSQLNMFRKKTGGASTWEEALSLFKGLHVDVRELMEELNCLFEMLVVVPASTATAERSFSLLRRVKTYLSSTMKQTRLNHSSILHAYQEEVDEINMQDVLREFVGKNDFRRSQFGIV